MRIPELLVEDSHWTLIPYVVFDDEVNSIAELIGDVRIDKELAEARRVAAWHYPTRQEVVEDMVEAFYQDSIAVSFHVPAHSAFGVHRYGSVYTLYRYDQRGQVTCLLDGSSEQLRDYLNRGEV